MPRKKRTIQPMSILDNGGTIRIQQARQMTGMSGSYIKKLIRAGSLRTSKVGKCRLIIKSDLEKLLIAGMKRGSRRQ